MALSAELAALQERQVCLAAGLVSASCICQALMRWRYITLHRRKGSDPVHFRPALPYQNGLTSVVTLLQTRCRAGCFGNAGADANPPCVVMALPSVGSCSGTRDA